MPIDWCGFPPGFPTFCYTPAQSIRGNNSNTYCSVLRSLGFPVCPRCQRGKGRCVGGGGGNNEERERKKKRESERKVREETRVAIFTRGLSHAVAHTSRLQQQNVRKSTRGSNCSHAGLRNWTFLLRFYLWRKYFWLGVDFKPGPFSVSSKTKLLRFSQCSEQYSRVFRQVSVISPDRKRGLLLLLQVA